ncbi:MAG TPA: hypothetical protein VJH55_02210 [Candidatus Paceibacterota bacterium]
MNELEQLQSKIKAQFPKAETKIDIPERSDGNFWLDTKIDTGSLTVEWRPDEGFGFYASDAGYGEGPEKIIEDVDVAFREALIRLTQ